MNYDTAHKLAQEIKASQEHIDYTEARDRIKENATTMALIKEYHKLQMELQSMMHTGNKDDAKMDRFKKLGEILQMDKDASAFLIAEYKLNIVIGDIYKIIAEAADVDLSALED